MVTKTAIEVVGVGLSELVGVSEDEGEPVSEGDGVEELSALDAAAPAEKEGLGAYEAGPLPSEDGSAGPAEKEGLGAYEGEGA